MAVTVDGAARPEQPLPNVDGAFTLPIDNLPAGSHTIKASQRGGKVIAGVVMSVQ